MQLLKFHKAYGTEFIGKRKLFDSWKRLTMAFTQQRCYDKFYN